MLSISTEAKRLFRCKDINDEDLAGYSAIRWWDEWVQLYQIYNNDISSIYDIAKELLNDNNCRHSSAKLIKIWEDLGVRARLTVQIATKIDYGMPFCRAGFNLEGSADGL